MAETWTILMSLVVAGIILVGTGVVLSVGTDITHDVREQVRESAEVVNESVTISGGVGTLAFGHVIGQLSQCNNLTDTYTVPDECNITTHSPDELQTITLAFEDNTGVWTTPNINVSYTRDLMERPSQAAFNSSKGFENIAKWQPTIGTVVVAGAIIAIIMATFVFAIARKGIRL